MSEVSSSATAKTGPTKKPTSSARNIIGIIVLIGVLVVCWFEYSALFGFRAAVAALVARTQDENQDLLTVQEAEKLLGKEPDGPATEFTEGSRRFAQKTFTWPGLLKHYTLTAYFTNEKDSRLHHFETEGSKYEPEPAVREATSSPQPSTGPTTKGRRGKSGKSAISPGPQPTIAPDSKGLPAGASEKGSTPKPQPSEKPAPGGEAVDPGDKGSSSKPATTPVPAKPPQ